MERPQVTDEPGVVEWFGKKIDLGLEGGKLEQLFWLYASHLVDTHYGMVGRLQDIPELIDHLWDVRFRARTPERLEYEARLRTLLKRLRERIKAAGITNVQIRCRTQYGHRMHVTDPNAVPPKPRPAPSDDELKLKRREGKRLCTYCDQAHWTANWTAVKRGKHALGYACKTAFDERVRRSLVQSRIVTDMRPNRYCTS